MSTKKKKSDLKRLGDPIDDILKRNLYFTKMNKLTDQHLGNKKSFLLLWLITLPCWLFFYSSNYLISSRSEVRENYPSTRCRHFKWLDRVEIYCATQHRLFYQVGPWGLFQGGEAVKKKNGKSNFFFFSVSVLNISWWWMLPFYWRFNPCWPMVMLRKQKSYCFLSVIR